MRETPSSIPLLQPSRLLDAETTTLHCIVREHLETHLALAEVSDPMGDGAQ